MNSFYETLINFYQQIFSSLGETLLMVFLSLLFSSILAIPAGFILVLCAKGAYFQNKGLIFVITSLVNVIKSIPFILLMIIMVPVASFIFGVGFGMFASVLSLSIIGFAQTTRLVEQAVSAQNHDLFDLGKSLSFGPFKTSFKILLPECLPQLILALTTSTISLVAFSMVVGIINGGGIGTLAIIEGVNRWNLNLIYLIIIVMVFLTVIIQVAGSLLARHFDRRKR